MRSRRLLLLCATITLLLTSRSSLFSQHIGPTPEPPGTEPLSKYQKRRSAVVALVEKVRAAVVNIHSERTVQTPPDSLHLSPSQSRINGMGTGIVIDHRGYIVTNHHVVEDVNVLRIRLSDGTSTSATVVARSSETDLALLKIEVGRLLPTIPLGTASDIMVGEEVIAIGNPYGYEHTVSNGLVSAIKRDVTLNKDLSYKSLIQTSAPINPGNSGGPLLNVNGEMIGVNVAIRAGAQGIGFAIPVDQMVRVVGDMLRRRRQGIYDGMTCRDQIDATADGDVRSVIVERVESDSPAAAAGVRKGDILLRVGDVPVACSYDVERGFLDSKVGERVAVMVQRDGGPQRLELVLQPAGRGRPGPGDLVRRKLGMQLSAVDPEVVTRVNRQLHGGLEVVAVDHESAAAQAGIRRGDILVGLHQWETLTLDNVSYVLSHPDLSTFYPLSFHIVRGGQIRRGWLNAAE